MINYVNYLFYSIMGNCLNCLLSFFNQTRTHRISGKKLRQIKQIAEGGYGYVILVEDVQTRKNYAMKKLICQTEQQRQNYKNQVKRMKEMSNCQYIIGFYGEHQIIRDGFLQAYILMQLAQKTVYDIVLDYQTKNRQIPQKLIISIMLDTAKGLKQMHDLGIVHRDVKVQNILISQTGRAKLCDFGSCEKQKILLSKIPKSQMYKYEQKFQKNTTLMYRPPQMIDLYLMYPVDERVDIWMLGCVLFVLNYGYHPFQEQGKLSIVNASIKYPKNKISTKMQNLIRLMLTPNPYFRIKPNQLIKVLSQWTDINEIPLNKVAKMIKQSEQYMQNGQYQKASKNQWRNLKLNEQ